MLEMEQMMFHFSFLHVKRSFIGAFYCLKAISLCPTRELISEKDNQVLQMGNTHATVLILLATMCTLLSGCTKDNDYTVTTGKGRLNIRLIADGSTQDVATRVEETLPDINDFAISVLKGDEVKYSCDKFSQYSDEVLFPIGQYTLKASYGQLPSEWAISRSMLL